jgi:hypothetical protein
LDAPLTLSARSTHYFIYYSRNPPLRLIVVDLDAPPLTLTTRRLCKKLPLFYLLIAAATTKVASTRREMNE